MLKKLLNFDNKIPIIDPIPMNNVKFNKDKPISKLPISWIVEDDLAYIFFIVGTGFGLYIVPIHNLGLEKIPEKITKFWQ